MGHGAPRPVRQGEPRPRHPRGYAAGNSVYAWGYLIVLIGGPLLGGMLGALGALGACAGSYAARRPEEQSLEAII